MHLFKSTLTLILSLSPQLLCADSLAPGYSPLTFTVPKPGSYQLPPLGLAANGDVVTTENNDIQLHQLMGDKIVLLSFIYSTCSDINGCPLATAFFHKIKRQLTKNPEVARQLRLLTLSFNPEHDTPEAMKNYAKGLQDPTLDWQFLTTRSEQQLRPILQHYRQNVQKIVDKQGRPTGTFSHILRVYLIDKNKQLRNIYSVSFLHADTLINDIKTLLNPDTHSSDTTITASNSALLYKKGDNKSAYAQENYQTPSIALTDRTGQATNLIQTVQHPLLGLPPVPVPVENPATKVKISLGKKLFYDRRLSHNNTFSCAMCHIPEQGFSSNEMATAVGVEGRSVRRNSHTLYNVAYYQSLFHDGRESTLEQQVWGPLLANNEMANPSIGYVINKINQLPDYQGLFEQAFTSSVSMENIGQAIASYERTLNSANSNFDRWYYAKQPNAISPSAQQGYQLFIGKAQCSSCHTLSPSYALFTDNQFHNTGIGYKNAMETPSTKTKVQVAPGVFVEVENKIINAVTEKKNSDLGRYEITLNPDDRWKYKTPSLRNINLTAPYMHDGSLATLAQVLQFYNQGGFSNGSQDPLIKPLNLTELEINHLVNFLKSLTGNNVQQLISDAYSVKVGDTTTLP